MKRKLFLALEAKFSVLNEAGAGPTRKPTAILLRDDVSDVLQAVPASFRRSTGQDLLEGGHKRGLVIRETWINAGQRLPDALSAISYANP